MIMINKDKFWTTILNLEYVKIKILIKNVNKSLHLTKIMHNSLASVRTKSLYTQPIKRAHTFRSDQWNLWFTIKNYIFQQKNIDAKKIKPVSPFSFIFCFRLKISLSLLNFNISQIFNLPILWIFVIKFYELKQLLCGVN